MAIKTRHTPRRGSVLLSETSILLTTGFLLFACGIALVATPEYSPRAQRVADVLTGKLGLHGSVLSLAGLVFFSLGVFCRRVTLLASAAPAAPTAFGKGRGAVDALLVVEQIAGEVAQLRNAVERVSSDVGKNAETLQRVLHSQDAVGQMQGQSQDEGYGPRSLENDPVFQLAGSLDRMSAQLDEGLHSLMARLDERSPGSREVSTAGPLETVSSIPVHDMDDDNELEISISMDDDPVYLDDLEEMAPREE